MSLLGGTFTIMMMVHGEGTTETLSGLIKPVAESLELHVHIDSVEAEIHKHPEPNVEVRVHGADRAGIIADVTGAMAEAGLNILDLNSEVSGTAESPVYVMIIDGAVEGGADKLLPAAEALNKKGLKVDIEAIETLVG